MNTFIKRALWGTLLAGGVTLLGATAAQAAETTGDDGILSGTQSIIDVALPVTLTGTSVSLIGDSTSTAPAAPAAAPAPAAPPAEVSTGGQDGVGSGTQALVSVSLPITVGGNAVSVLGDSESSSAPAPAPEAPAPAAPATEAGDGSTTTGEDGILGGTQVIAPLAAPVTVTGNAITLLGDSESSAAPALAPEAPAPSAPATEAGDGSTTTGEDGILGGTQVIAPLAAPVTVTGNAITVLGDSASTGSPASAAPAAEAGDGTTTTGENAVAGGTQVAAPLALPITVGGNAISVAGDSTALTPAAPTDVGDPGGPLDPTTPGTPGTSGTPASSGSGAAAFAARGTGSLAATGGSEMLLALLLGLTLAVTGGVVMTLRHREAH